MKKVCRNLFYILIPFCITINGSAQNGTMDSLKLLLKTAKQDTIRLNILNTIIDQESDDNIWPDYNKQLKEISESNLSKITSKDPSYQVYLKYLATAFNNYGLLYQYGGEPQKAVDYFESSIKLLKEVKDKKTVSSCFNNIGGFYMQQGKILLGLEYLEKSMKLKEELKDRKGMSVTLINLAYIFQRQGNVSKALEYYFEALKISEEFKDKGNIAQCLNSIGYTYQTDANYEKALEYFGKSLALRTELGDKQGMAICMNNMGFGYYARKEYTKALDYYNKSLLLYEEINNIQGKGALLNNIGRVFMDQDSMDKARIYFEKSLNIKEETRDKEGVANTLANIAEACYKQGNFAKALESGQKCLALGRELGFPGTIKSAASLLYKVYKKQNKGIEALEMFELSSKMRDSIANQERHEANMKKEFQFEYERKVLEDSLKNAAVLVQEQIKHEEQIKQQRLYTYGGVIGFAMMLIIAGISFAAFRNKKKANLIITNQKLLVEMQKAEVENQKHKVETHQKEIIDSITYAKRLQEAILPPEKTIKEHLPNSFVFYKPKDIVAGDFYWFEHLNGVSYLAVADCTGHGVPGALVSMVCISALNRAVLEFGITDPGKILDKTRELVLETFAKGNEDVKDGMDISLVKIELIKESKKLPQGKLIIPKGQSFSDVAESMLKYKVEWAGANNPLWYFKGGEYFEIKANKQSIGKTENASPFTSHSLELAKGDMLYLFTDGQADQFGGPKGKKFKYKQLLEVLSDNKNRSPEDQKQALSSSFQTWKGNLEQIDDVTIIGIRV